MKATEPGVEKRLPARFKLLGVGIVVLALAGVAYLRPFPEPGADAPSLASSSGAERSLTPDADASSEDDASQSAGGSLPIYGPDGVVKVPEPFPQVGQAFLERFDLSSPSARWLVSDGWSNGDYMENDWRAAQLAAAPGALKFILAPNPGAQKPLTSAEMRTTEFYRYGYFETRMKVPRDPGLVTGAFTFSQADGVVPNNEIDIEILGRNTRQVELTYHVGGKARGVVVPLPFDAADGFHSYAFEWRPASIRWYADNVLIHEARGGDVRKLVNPQQFFLHLWGSEMLKHWVGPLSPADGPWTLEVSCTAYAPDYRGRSLCGDDAGEAVAGPVQEDDVRGMRGRF
jgi:hypothetical protein